MSPLMECSDLGTPCDCQPVESPVAERAVDEAPFGRSRWQVAASPVAVQRIAARRTLSGWPTATGIHLNAAPEGPIGGRGGRVPAFAGHCGKVGCLGIAKAGASAGDARPAFERIGEREGFRAVLHLTAMVERPAEQPCQSGARRGQSGREVSCGRPLLANIAKHAPS